MAKTKYMVVMVVTPLRVVMVMILFTEVLGMTLLLAVKVSIQYMVVQVMTLSESE